MEEDIRSDISKDRLKLKDYIMISMGAVLLAICSWISVPFTVPFTMQTFGLFLILHVLGGKRGLLCVVIYIILGMIGVPVFSGFSSGLGVIFGSTGGYVIGFLFVCLIYMLGIRLFGKSLPVKMILQSVGLIVCYLFGTLWFVLVYSKNSGGYGFLSALSLCVFPFIIPDAIKLVLAAGASKLINKIFPEMPGR